MAGGSGIIEARSCGAGGGGSVSAGGWLGSAVPTAIGVDVAGHGPGEPHAGRRATCVSKGWAFRELLSVKSNIESSDYTVWSQHETVRYRVSGVRATNDRLHFFRHKKQNLRLGWG